jgi:fructose-1,6-bisphosphatase/inositol monophosphatase family enzyme
MNLFINSLHLNLVVVIVVVEFHLVLFSENQNTSVFGFWYNLLKDTVYIYAPGREINNKQMKYNQNKSKVKSTICTSISFDILYKNIFKKNQNLYKK